MTNYLGLVKNYNYDANGNMTSRGTQTIAWTVDNQVASIAISGGGTTSMEYACIGTRVKKAAPATST